MPNPSTDRGDGALTIEHHQQATTRERIRLRLCFVVLAIIATGLIALFLVMPKGTLLQQAVACQEIDPYKSLRLLDQAITDAGGSYPDAQVKKCELLGSLEGWPNAERYFDSIDSLETCDQTILCELAEAAWQHNSERLAVEALERANRVGTEQERVVRMLLSIKYDLGERSAALELCEKLVKLAPDDPEPWLVSAGIHHGVERFSPALAAYKGALERLEPGQESHRVRFQIAEVSIHLGDLETADRHIQILRSQAKSAPQVDLAYAKLLRRRGQNSDAKVVVDSVIANSPQFPGSLMLRGLLNSDKGDFHAAAADFRGVVEINPYDHRAHYRLAQAYQQLNKPDKAEDHFQASRRLTDAVSLILILGKQLDENPTSRDLRLKLAEQHLVLGDVQAAEHWRQAANNLH